ncbi:MAG: hypothetical protein D6731_18235 [Planctomycetota bacterium]|nr:MAG: hypothetical protein D6731_18235 [Planctomycetota bacterium]
MSGLNRREWRGQRGLYEAWYLTLRDPESGWAFWFRVSIHVPPDGLPGEACLWAFSFPPGGNGAGRALELLDRYPLKRFLDRSNGKVFDIELGPARFEVGSAAGLACGAVGHGARRIAWDLRLDENDARGFRHVSPVLYRLGIASSAVATPGLRFRASGIVRVGEREIRLRNAVGEQGHVFGRRHASRWAWVHCNEFEGAPAAIFEGVSARVRKGGLLLPPASPLCLRLAPGRRLTWSGPHELWTTESRFSLGSWSFEAYKRDLFLRGTVSASPEDFVSVEYRDPDGRRVYCNHTEAADVTLDLFERRGPGWELARRLVARGVAAFEVGDERRDPRPRRRLDLAEARPA